MRTLYLLLFISLALPAFTQDDEIITDNRPSKNFGLCGAFSFSNMRLNSAPFLLENSPGSGSVKVENSPGFTGGVFFLIPRAHVRSGVELTMMPTMLSYDMGSVNREESWIYPLTVDIPAHAFVSGLLPESKLKPALVLGGRLIVPIPLLNSVYPELRKATANLEVGISIPVNYAKTVGSVELVYSLSVMNLTHPEIDHVKNHSVKSIHRDFISLRAYFN